MCECWCTHVSWLADCFQPLTEEWGGSRGLPAFQSRPTTSCRQECPEWEGLQNIRWVLHLRGYGKPLSLPGKDFPVQPLERGAPTLPRALERRSTHPINILTPQRELWWNPVSTGPQEEPGRKEFEQKQVLLRRLPDSRDVRMYLETIWNRHFPDSAVATVTASENKWFLQ